MNKVTLALLALLMVVMSVLTACANVSVSAQPETPEATSTAAPSATPTPKPMTSVSVTNDGDMVVLESARERFEITFVTKKDEFDHNDAQIVRYMKYHTGNEKQQSNDTMVCNMVNWMLGPYIAGKDYTSACYRLWYHEPDTFLVKTYPEESGTRMEVYFTDLFQVVK